LVADKGRVKHLSDLMSVYRRTPVSNSFNPKYSAEFVIIRQMELFNLIDEYYKNKYNYIIEKKLSN